MPALANPKHERFAQALAKGETADAAYVLAGYEENRGNAARLKANESIETRVAEILERAATRAEITVASISDRLLKIAEKCERTSEANKLGVARATLMDVAKLNGLIVDKREHTGRNGGPIEYANLTEEEIDARIAALEAGDGEPEPVGEA
ncbi:hypothetical protein [Brevundimonas sp.]|uniref:hypothetical protein n=1 Tax=Brevundimonas sp. TaxID=1871086 RepID=UPI0028A73CC9|nr:hypothetical protein [Brevundimonas sp.]